MAIKKAAKKATRKASRDRKVTERQPDRFKEAYPVDAPPRPKPNARKKPS